MAEKYTGIHPFAYDDDYYMCEEKESADTKTFISFMKQRNAKYMEPAEEVYNNENLDDEEMAWRAFRDNIEPPTPQLQVIDGYDSAEECSGDSEEGGNGNDSEEDNNNGN